MAGNAAALRTYLANVLGIPAPVVNHVVDVHGYDSMDIFAEAQRSELENLVSTIRKTRSVAGITTEVSMMSSYNAYPRVEHLHAVLHIFAYLQQNLDWRLVMDAAYNDHLVQLKEHDWKEFYPWAKDEMPSDAPAPLGKKVKIVMFVDASHAANLVTRQSRTGVLIFVNKAPIIWYSKKQNSVETSSFGSEFTALKTGVELLEGLRYKLRMMGVPIDGYAHTLVDNMSVVNNTSVPESTLKKKSNSIAYHYVRSKCAADILRVDFERSESNLADMLTKVHAGTVRAKFRNMVMYPGN